MRRCLLFLFVVFNIELSNTSVLFAQDCPANITTNVSAGTCGRVVNFTPPASFPVFCNTPRAIAGYTLLGNFDGHSYFISNNAATWRSAKVAAEALGGHLVTITSAKEDSFIVSKTSTRAWLGLTDEVTEGKWLWITGEPLVYSDWSPGQPDDYNKSQDYAIINWSGKKWDDWAITLTTQYIVEFECDGTTSFTTTQTSGLPSGSIFPLGTTTNSFVIKNYNVESVNCSFTITVVDDEKPTIKKGNIALNYQTKEDAEAAALNVTTCFDNCTPIDKLIRTVSTEGTCNALITVTVTDASNNSSSVEYATKIDNSAPVLSSLPLDTLVSCDNVPSIEKLTAIDNCDGIVPVDLIETSTKGIDPAMSNFYNYTISRRWSTSDNSSNSTTHGQLIFVKDVTAPEITCPTIKDTYIVNEKECSYKVRGNELNAFASDRCASLFIKSIYKLSGATNGEYSTLEKVYFNVGITNINYTATDPSGNSSTCNYRVKVLSDLNVSLPQFVYAINSNLSSINANTLYIGYEGAERLKVEAVATGGSARNYSYLWTAPNGNLTIVSGVNSSSVVITTATANSKLPYIVKVAVVDDFGCLVTKEMTLNVVEVRCGNKADKVLVCKKPDAKNPQAAEICISINAVSSMLEQGYRLGSCLANQNSNSSPGKQKSLASERVGNSISLNLSSISFELSPNPTRGQFFVRFNRKGLQADVTIQNTNGEVVARKMASVQTEVVAFNVNYLPAGMYLVKVVTTEGIQVRKLIVL